MNQKRVTCEKEKETKRKGGGGRGGRVVKALTAFPSISEIRLIPKLTFPQKFYPVFFLIGKYESKIR